MYGRILKSLNIVNFYRGMSKLKLKINLKVPQLPCIVVSVPLNFEFGRFGKFCIDCYYTFIRYTYAPGLKKANFEIFDFEVFR